jgi:hypothetical protein
MPSAAADRAIKGYTIWEPIATQAFDLLLRGTGETFAVAAIYDRGLIEGTDEPQGWLDDGDGALDMDAVSAHARLAFCGLRAAFEDGVQGWMEPIRSLSRSTGLRLYVNARFERVGTGVQPWFHILVEPGEVVVEGATLHGMLQAFDEAVTKAYA